MPLYDTRCQVCKNEEQVVKKISEDFPPCTSCGGATEVVIKKVNFILTGSGWSSKEAKEDYRMEKIL